MLCKVTHCVGHVAANTRPHQQHWGNEEMEAVISCKKTVRWLALSTRSELPSLSAPYLVIKSVTTNLQCCAQEYTCTNTHIVHQLFRSYMCT